MWAGCAECQSFLPCLSLLAMLEVDTAMIACTQRSWVLGRHVMESLETLEIAMVMVGCFY